MKNCIIPLLLLQFCITGFSQDLGYGVRTTYQRSVKKEKLSEAKTMRDINPGYPFSWITDYISTEVLVTCNGKILKSVSANDTLSTEQRSLLNMADMGTDIVVDAKHNYRNSTNSSVEVNNVHFSLTVVPDIEAEYHGGYEQMMQYLKENAIHKISETIDKALLQAIVRFTVNKEGEITNAQISKTSKDEKTDKLLLEVINKMPKWRAAQNSNGLKVKQEFEFSVGNLFGC